jgi:hypothetical protein
MSTASIAADVIRAAESNTPDATPSSPASSNAPEYPDLAIDEMDHLAADDPNNITRRTAAAMTVLADQRPFVSTRQGMVRREFNDDGNATRRAAREMIDQSEWAKGQKADPRDKRAMQAHDFAADVNKSTMESTLPIGGSFAAPGSKEWREAGDAVIDRIIERGRNK